MKFIFDPNKKKGQRMSVFHGLGKGLEIYYMSFVRENAYPYRGREISRRRAASMGIFARVLGTIEEKLDSAKSQRNPFMIEEIRELPRPRYIQYI